MTEPVRDNDRDEVLYAFHRAYDCPTAEQIAEWVARYPQFADDIRAHAAISWDWKANEQRPVVVPDGTVMARGLSYVLDAMYKARLAAQTKPVAVCESFQQLLSAAGTNVPKLSSEWNIGRSVLADLVNGAMRAPVGRRLVRAFQDTFGLTIEAFERLVSYATSTPRLGHAKASAAPTVRTRSYQEVIMESTMSQQQKAYWLSEE